MKMKPKLRCEVCHRQENVYRLTNYNLCICKDCIKEICPDGYFNFSTVENGIIYGELYVNGGGVDLNEGVARKYKPC